MSELVTKPGEVRCEDCNAARTGRPAKQSRQSSGPTAEQLRAAGIDPAEAAAYLNG
jgi:hypothetical protein